MNDDNDWFDFDAAAVVGAILPAGMLAAFALGWR